MDEKQIEEEVQRGDGFAPTLSVVIPVYQSATTLPNLMNRLSEVLERHQISHEFIFVEDGSPDNSWAVLQELHEANPKNMTLIQLMRNFGQHNALMCGFRYARGQFVLTMDDDLQNPPEEIPKLLDAIRDGSYDVVYGASRQRKEHLYRRAGSYLVRRFCRFLLSLMSKSVRFVSFVAK